MSRLINRFCYVIFAITIASSPVNAATDPAYAAFDKGHYLKAIKEAKKAAARGEPQAFTLLGRIYAEGRGVARNYNEAVHWYQRGAGKGDVDSQFALAVLLANGKGIAKNINLAADLFEQAAKKGHEEAQYNLALIYIDGRGRKQNMGLAFKYMRLAANKGNAKAQYDLGTFYNLGRGVKPNARLAVKWTKAAADSGLPNAQLEYAIMLIKGLGLSEEQWKARRKDKAWRARDDREAAKYLTRAAMRGNAVAQNRLARLYLYGFGVPRNLLEAAKWHLIAKTGGVSDGKLDILLIKLTKEQRAQVDQAVQNWQNSE